jgi:hypothetical protein
MYIYKEHNKYISGFVRKRGKIYDSKLGGGGHE